MNQHHTSSDEVFTIIGLMHEVAARTLLCTVGRYNVCHLFMDI